MEKPNDEIFTEHYTEVNCDGVTTETISYDLNLSAEDARLILHALDVYLDDVACLPFCCGIDIDRLQDIHELLFLTLEG